MKRHTHNTQSGFTLIEMMVVIAIMVLLIAMIPASLNALRGNRTTAGLNTVAAASSAARQFATQKKTFLKPLDGAAHGKYSGTAMLFTPANEIRLVENDQTADAGSNNYLEIMSPPRDGFKDIPSRDYITIPRGVGVVGIVRNGNDPYNDIRLYAPPFAVRFNEHGHLIACDLADATSTVIDRMLYYDGNYNGSYAIGSGRPNNYNADQHDPERGNGTFEAGTVNKWRVPFERIETVIAVVVFDKDDFRASVNNAYTHNGPDNSLTNAAKEWILENGRILYFNRYTGVPMRNQ